MFRVDSWPCRCGGFECCCFESTSTELLQLMRVIVNLSLVLRHAERYLQYGPALTILQRSVWSDDHSLPSVHVAALHSASIVPVTPSSSSRILWWSAAGAAALLLQRLETAYAEERVQEPDGVGNKSTAQWRLYTNLGNDTFHRGDKDKAERYLKRALEEARKGFGENDGHVGAACNNLAELYMKMGDPGKAEPLYHEALRILKAAYGSKDTRYAAALHNISLMFLAQKRWSLARKHCAQAVKIVEEKLGRHHTMFAHYLMGLSDVENVAGDRAAAIAILQQAQLIFDAQGPASAQDSLNAAHKLGQLLMMNGQTAEGLPLLRRCVQQAEGLYSEGSPRRSVVLPLHLNCLADALQKTGELEEARELLHRSIGLRSGAGFGSSLSHLLLTCADLELKIGARSGARDCFLRAHNLAQQMLESAGKTWAAAEARGRPPPSRWRLPLTRKEQPVVEASRGTITLLSQWTRGYSLLAAAQEKLGRQVEARQSLLAGLQLLQRPAARPKEASQQPLEVGQSRFAEAWMEVEVQYLQRSVDLLYHFLRLLGDDQGSQEIDVVQWHLANLQSRIPGLKDEAPAKLPAITALGGLVWNARERLNRLQIEINELKQREAREEPTSA